MVLQKVGEFATNILVNGSQEASYTQADDASYDVGVNSSISYSEDHQSAEAPATQTQDGYDCSVTMPRNNYAYLEIHYTDISGANADSLYVAVNGSDGPRALQYGFSAGYHSGSVVLQGAGGDPTSDGDIYVFADSDSGEKTTLDVYGRYNYNASHSVTGVSKS